MLAKEIKAIVLSQIPDEKHLVELNRFADGMEMRLEQRPFKVTMIQFLKAWDNWKLENNLA